MKNKEKHQKAAALKYSASQDEAPIVIAQGQGDLAKKIISLAKESDIPIHQDQNLVELLLTLELGTEIPEELYDIVAEILGFIYDLEDLI